MVSAMAAHFFVPYSPTRLRSCWSSASVHTVVRPVGAPGGFEAAADAAADADAACFAFPFLVLAAAPAPAPAPVLPAGGGGGALPVAPGGGGGGFGGGIHLYVRTTHALLRHLHENTHTLNALFGKQTAGPKRVYCGKNNATVSEAWKAGKKALKGLKS